MTRARHRRQRPVRDFAGVLMLLFVLWYRGRRPLWRPTPTEVSAVGSSMARLPWCAERIPLQVSPAEHWAGVRQIESYGNGAGAPVA